MAAFFLVVMPAKLVPDPIGERPFYGPLPIPSPSRWRGLG